MLAKFPFQDTVLTDHGIPPSAVLRLSTRFLKACSNEKRDEILHKFYDFRVMQNECLPSIDCTDSTGIESYWMAMGKMTTLSDQSIRRFGNLAQLCKILLVL